MLKRTENQKRKNLSLFALLVFMLILIVGVTFAWEDYNQHKSNVVSSTDEIPYKVRLIDQFDPNNEQALNWQPYQSVTKKVYVKNEGDGEAYVRLTLKEFMEIFPENYIYSDLRYMIDENGSYLKSTEEIPKAIVADLNAQIKATNYHNQGLELTEEMISPEIDRGEDQLEANDAYRVYKVVDHQGESAHYIATRKGDANGQYGRHVILHNRDHGEIIVGGGEDGDQRPNQVGAKNQHHNKFDESENSVNKYCNLYDPIYFDKSLSQNKSREYIDLNHPTDALVSLSDYSANKEAYSQGIWVYVDAESNEQEQAYVYWSQALQPQTETSLILESLYLKKVYKGSFDYFNHIDMEAVSQDDLSLWEELPKELEEDFSGSESWVPPITEEGDYIIDNYEWRVLFDADEPLWGMSDANHRRIVNELGLKEGDQLIATTSVLVESDIELSIPTITHKYLYPTVQFIRPNQKPPGYDDHRYSGSQLKIAMDYYSEKLHNNPEIDEIMKHAYPVNIEDEKPRYNDAAQPKYVDVIDRSAAVDAKGEVFILGAHEINYLELRNVSEALKTKANLSDNSNKANYWLRSPAVNNKKDITFITEEGLYASHGFSTYLALRPAMWVNFKAN